MLPMNIIAGWMMPEMNWALKLAWNSASLCSVNARFASFRRPKTFTSVCPVYISSMWPLSWPVSPTARRSVAAPACRSGHDRSRPGTVTSAISASSQEIKNIITSTPTMVSSDMTIWLSVCCRVWAMLSMSLVTRLSISPRGWRSK